jgi:site-specific recombinase XerD
LYVEQIVRKHANVASRECPSLKNKRVTPHVLRHSAAMHLLQNGVDRTVIALWLGHESVETTQMYIHADIQLKEKAMARTRPVKAPPGRYRPDDKLLAFLEAL